MNDQFLKLYVMSQPRIIQKWFPPSVMLWRRKVELLPIQSLIKWDAIKEPGKNRKTLEFGNEGILSPKMKIFGAMVTALLVLPALAYEDYYVAVKEIGHVNADGATSTHDFYRYTGNVACGLNDGCVGSEGVFWVRVVSASEDMQLELFPLRGNYAISVMCQDAGKRLNSCRVYGSCTPRAGYGSCSNPLVMWDSSTRKGCTFVGSGYATAEVQIAASCD